MKFAKYKCLENYCGKVFIAMSDRHRTDYCPDHNDTFVDMETEYVRVSNAKLVEAFDPSQFESEDDYHSALMSWLNDSDEEFVLEFRGKQLQVVRVNAPTIRWSSAAVKELRVMMDKRLSSQSSPHSR